MKTCTVDGCDRKHRARGMCSAHYNRATGNVQTAQDREALKVVKTCEQCGSEFRSAPHHDQRFCSRSCVRRPPSRRTLALRKINRARNGTSGSRTWVQGQCSQCETQFIGPVVVGNRYCDKSCAYRGAREQKLANNPQAFRATRSRAARRYRQTHPDIVRLSKSRYRARLYGAGHEPYNRAEIFAAYGGTCAYCDAPAEHLDHVHPLSKGGADAAHNLLPACAPCNLTKSAKTLAEWASTFTKETL